MILKITLTHADEGSIDIPEPDGWKGAAVGIERSLETWACSPFLKSPFNAFGAFRSWCLLVERNHGPDAIITAKVRYCPDDLGFTFYELFPNSDIEIAVGSFTESVNVDELGHGLEYGFVLRSYYAKFLQRFETPVNVQSTEDLDGNEVDPAEAITIALTPQKIQKKHTSIADKSIVFGAALTTDYVQIDWETEQLAEINTKYHIGNFINPEIPVALMEIGEAGEHSFNLSKMYTRHQITGSGGVGDPFVSTLQNLAGWLDLFFQINNEAPIAWTPTHGISSGDGYTLFEYIATHDLNVGDQIRVYGVPLQNFAGTDLLDKLIQIGPDTSNIPGDIPIFNPTFTSGFETHIAVIAQTTYPETEAEGFLTHDLLDAVAKRICGAPVYSETLGSPNTIARQYDYVGCASNFMHFKGLQLRQYLLSEKPFFISAKDIWNGINPVHCLAMGIDRVDGVDVVRVWKRSELFDENRVSATLSNVRNISRSYDQEEFFNLVTVGWDKGKPEDVLGIDDSYKSHYATILKKLGKKIEILSSMIGTSLAFEITRRFVREKSADYKFDDETFILAVTRDEYVFRPELNEEFTDVTGLLNEETRYNKRIRSVRNLLRWLDYLSGCLQAYTDSNFKFTGAEGNSDIQDTMTPNDCGDDFGGQPLSSKQDIPVSDNYLFWPIAYTIRTKISFGQWLQIIGDMNAAIRVSQSESHHMPFFTKTLSVQLSESFLTLTAWPKRFFPLQIVQNNDTEHEGRAGRVFDQTFGLQFN